MVPFANSMVLPSTDKVGRGFVILLLPGFVYVSNFSCTYVEACQKCMVQIVNCFWWRMCRALQLLQHHSEGTKADTLLLDVVLQHLMQHLP